MNLNWENAEKWAEKANNKKVDNEPKWKWDCGYKLDFDGALLEVSSRFYPPHKNNSNYWEGTVSILFLNEEILVVEFKHKSLDKLKEEVECFVKNYSLGIKSRLISASSKNRYSSKKFAAYTHRIKISVKGNGQDYTFDVYTTNDSKECTESYLKAKLSEKGYSLEFVICWTTKEQDKLDGELIDSLWGDTDK